MKIKRDFVTNSSSCSYIVCIPDMKKAIERISEQMILSEDNVERLENSDRYGYISFYGEREYDQQLHDDFFRILGILKDVGYPVLFDESGDENYCRMINIAYTSELREKIKYVMKDV